MINANFTPVNHGECACTGPRCLLMGTRCASPHGVQPALFVPCSLMGTCTMYQSQVGVHQHSPRPIPSDFSCPTRQGQNGSAPCMETFKVLKESYSRKEFSVRPKVIPLTKPVQALAYRTWLQRLVWNVTSVETMTLRVAVFPGFPQKSVEPTLILAQSREARESLAHWGD